MELEAGMKCDVCDAETTASYSYEVGGFRICNLCMGDWIKMLREWVFSQDGWYGTSSYKGTPHRRLRLKTK